MKKNTIPMPKGQRVYMSAIGGALLGISTIFLATAPELKPTLGALFFVGLMPIVIGIWLIYWIAYKSD